MPDAGGTSSLYKHRRKPFSSGPGSSSSKPASVLLPGLLFSHTHRHLHQCGIVLCGTGSTWLCLLTSGVRASRQPSTEGLRQPAAGSKSRHHPPGRGRTWTLRGAPHCTLSLKQPEPPPEDTHRSTSRGSGRHLKHAPPRHPKVPSLFF